MNKKRTKAIRNFLALLVLLTTGGTQQVWADEAQDLSDINSNLTINPPDGSGGTAVATSSELGPFCHSEILKVVITVKPGSGYYTNLNLITAEHVTDGTPYPKSSGSDVISVDEADTNPDKGYSDPRTVTIYWDNSPTPQNIKITVKFKPIGLELRNGLGEFNDALPGEPDDMKPRATVTFYEPNDDFDPENPAKFNPTDYLGDDTGEHLAKMPATVIDNTDEKDRWVIAHIVPANGCWTDESLLFAYEAGAAATRTRTSAPGIELGPRLTLLKADTYSDTSSEPAVTKDRHDGAGWYYYKIPGSHKFSYEDTGYKYSIINGFVPEKFELHNPERTTMTGNVLTVTDGTTNGWKAVLTYDKLNFTFDCDTHCPQVTKLSISNQGTTLFDFDGSTTEGRAAIDKLVKCGPDPIPASIWPTHYVQTRDSQGYPNGWFVGTEGVAIYSIDVPFTPLNPSDAVNLPGSEDNPWLIRNADELNMLSKCYTIGAWYSNEQYFKQTADIDMSEVNDFLPIGVSNPGVSFRGHYDGNGKTISGIKVTYSTESLDPLDPTNAYVGLFGLVEGDSDFPSSVQNVTLVNSSFSATASSCAVAVGGIAGSIQGSNPDDAMISNCKFLVNGEGATSAISGLPTDCATGAIVGNIPVGTLSQNYYGYGVTVTNSSGTASGYTKRGTWMGTVPLEGGTPTYSWVDFTPNDGAMLYVKKATIAGSTSTNGSAVTFNEVKKGTDRYDKDGDDFYYAVGQPVTLSVTLGSRTEKTDIRTFYDELTALTMNDGTTDTDIKDALGFTMPEADATVTATIDESKWFTIPSNNKNWMSFYHEWKDASGASANYIVTDGDAASGTTAKTITVKTITGISLSAATVTTADLEGVSYSGVPTLFNCDDNLPALLRFDPVADKTAPTNVTDMFKGLTSDTDMSAFKNLYVMNGIGDFYFADDKSVPLYAHRCYIDLGNTAVVAPARLRIVNGGETDGIEDNYREEISNNRWFTIDGRMLDGRPQKKGIYINGGQKVVIK